LEEENTSFKYNKASPDFNQEAIERHKKLKEFNSCWTIFNQSSST